MYIIERHFNEDRYFLSNAGIHSTVQERRWSRYIGNALHSDNRITMSMFMEQFNLQNIARVHEVDPNELVE